MAPDPEVKVLVLRYLPPAPGQGEDPLLRAAGELRYSFRAVVSDPLLPCGLGDLDFLLSRLLLGISSGFGGDFELLRSRFGAGELDLEFLLCLLSGQGDLELDLPLSRRRSTPSGQGEEALRCVRGDGHGD